MEKGYLLRVLRNASLEKLKGAVETVHRRTGKNRAAIFLDMAQCALRYGAGYYDYMVFGFYDLTAAQRKTYITRVISKKLNVFMNQQEYAHLFDNKDEFCTLFKDYIGREILVMAQASREEVREFVSTRQVLFCKLRDKECGIGCERLNVADFESFDKLYDYLLEKGFGTIEDNVEQHPILAKINPDAVNCMRIITLIGDDGKPHCLYVVQKIGLGGSVVDNNSMFTPVDLETGRLMYPAHSGETTLGIVYTEQPVSHIPIQGFQVPFVKEAVEMCLKAAMVVPQIRYIGWDVATTPTGPAIIEGNTYTAHDFWQLPPHTPDHIGMLPTILKYAPSFKY